MGWLDWVLIALIGSYTVFVTATLIRRMVRGKTGCGGQCASCSGCSGCHRK